jgi:lipoic acid synthetase
MTRVLDLISHDPRAARPRHPEKVHRSDQPVMRKAPWIRVKAPASAKYVETRVIVCVSTSS